MKQATFGEKIDDIESVVFEFKMSYANLREYINTYFENISLDIPWKVHIAVNHIVPFLKSTNTDNGLGIYSEQAGESVHHEFKKTWNKYKRRQSHPDYAKRLKSSVVELSTFNK